MTQVLAPVGGGSNIGEAITLADGGYMVVWTHLVTSLLPIPNVTDVQFTAVLGRVFNADGSPRGAVFQVNQSNAASGQGQADITLLSNGNVAVVWTDGPSITAPFDVAARGRILSSTGAPVTDEIELSASTQRDQRIPQVAAAENGGFFATWSDGRDPWSNTREQWLGQEFDAAGNRIGPELWLRDDRFSEDSELVRINRDTYALIAGQGVVFDTDSTRPYQGTIQQPTDSSTQNFSSPDIFGYEDDAATDGNGNVVTVSPYAPFALIVRVYSYAEQPGGVVRNPDGTSSQPPVPGLNGPSEFVARDVALGWTGFNERPPGVTFTPQSQFSPSTAVTYLPNGNIAVVWTGVSGGTAAAPTFSVYAQIISAEGVILSDRVVIEDENVRGTDIYPPFVSAGADGRLFIGWTGITDRNGAGTNEVMGGVFDVPTYDLGAISPSGAFATPGNDVVTGTPFSVEDAGLWRYFLLDGDDTWTEGNVLTDGVGEVYGMGGDDRFVFGPSTTSSERAIPGLGRDTFDFSLRTAGMELPDQNLSNLGNASEEAEIVIGTRFADTALVSGGTVSQGRLLHTEAGDDVIQFFANTGMTVDGGDGVDQMTTFTNRAEWQLTFHGTHYTLDFLNNGTAPINPERTLTVRAVERIVFGDQTVDLLATASQFSGGAVYGPVLPGGILGTPGADRLVGTAGPDLIQGLGGSDVLQGEGGNDTLYGGDGTDTLSGGTGDDFIFGGATAADLRDVVFGGDGRDSIDGGAGNDELNGGNGNDTILGGAGADTLVGNADNDLIAGGAGGDLMSGNAGNDTLNGGFGFDRMNGGTGADQFFHQGVRDHGSDWIQDYAAAEGDVLAVGIAGATASQFQVNFATTVGAGSASVQEAFVIYRPTGQVLWALVDGADDTAINLVIGGQVFDLVF